MSTPRITMPTRGVYDKKFRYRDSAHTDIRETFKTFRRAAARAQRQAEERQQSLDLDNVVALPLRGAQ